MKKKTETTTVLMTASDFATKERLSRTAVNNMIKENRIQAVRIGGMWLVQAEAEWHDDLPKD